MIEIESLRRTAFFLVLATLLWNLLEAVVALWAGLEADSASLLTFGLDSVIELLAGGILLLRLSGVGLGRDEATAERRARRLVGLSFFALAAYIVLHSGASLLGWLPEPQPSLTGIVLVVASAVVMTVFYVVKMRIAVRIQSRALRAEALESLFCDLQDLVVLVGIGLNALLSWWWADPVAALFLVPLLVKEGLENLTGEEEEDEDGAPRVCFGRHCLYGLRYCRAACCAG